MEPPRFEDDAEINLSLNSSSAQKEKSLSFRRLEPSACPARADVGNVGEPHTLKASERPAGIDSQEICSVCQMRESKEGGGIVNTHLQGSWQWLVLQTYLM